MEFITDDGKVEKRLDMRIIEDIRIGFYKFDFVGLSEAQSHNICNLINAMLDNGVIELGCFIRMLKEWRVAYRLQYSSRENLSAEENLKLYAEEFLPFYRKLLDKGLLIEI